MTGTRYLSYQSAIDFVDELLCADPLKMRQISILDVHGVVRLHHVL